MGMPEPPPSLKTLFVEASCTAGFIHNDPGGLARTLGLPILVIRLQLPTCQSKEKWETSKTSNRLILARAETCTRRGPQPCNILGPAALSFRNCDDIVRKNADRNSEAFAVSRGLANISIETLYDAKAHYSR